MNIIKFETIEKKNKQVENFYWFIETTTKFEFNLGFAKVSKSVKKVKE